MTFPLREQLEALPLPGLRQWCALARALLSLEQWRSVGLLEGGPPVSVPACREVLAVGTARGIELTLAEVSAAIDVLTMVWDEEGVPRVRPSVVIGTDNGTVQ